eukprot:gene18673-25191_t
MSFVRGRSAAGLMKKSDLGVVSCVKGLLCRPPFLAFARTARSSVNVLAQLREYKGAGGRAPGHQNYRQVVMDLLMKEVEEHNNSFLRDAFIDGEMRAKAASMSKQEGGDGSFNFTEKQEEVMQGMALSMGLDSSDALVETLVKLFGEERQVVVAGLVMGHDKALKAIEKLKKEGLLEKEIAGEESKTKQKLKKEMGNAADEGWAGSQPPQGFIPSVQGFPCNEEVDTYHQACYSFYQQQDAIYSTHPLPSHKSTFLSVGGAALSELSPVTLQDLLLHPEKCLDCKLELTVVQPAFAAVAVTATVADRTGQHMRLAVYNTLVTTLAQAEAFLPVGAKLVLKNPFLKRCNDLWLGLRVDQPSDLMRLDMPLSTGARGRLESSFTQVLVLGDGDFSFSLALALHKTPLNTSNAQITVTSIDTREEVMGKFSKGRSNLRALMNLSHIDVIHGVDATDLDVLDKTWDLILWNFPYPICGSSKTVMQPSEECHTLMKRFFGSVGSILEPDGEIRIVLAGGQGGTTREISDEWRTKWRMEEAAASGGFDLHEIIPFDPTSYPGYEQRRDYVDVSFPGRDPCMHIFRRADPETMTPEKGPATNKEDKEEVESKLGSGPRHLLGRLASFARQKLLDPRHGLVLGLNKKPPRGSQINNAVDLLRPSADTSRVAAQLLDAAESCDSARGLLRNILGEVDPPPMHECQRVVDLLSRAFSIRYGGLVNNWTVGEAAAAWECARGVVTAYLPDVFSPDQGPGDRPHEDMWFALFNAAIQQRAADTFSPSQVDVPKMSQDTVDSLASAALVMTYATLTVSDDTHAVRLLDVWIGMGVGDVRLHSMRADLKLFELNRLMDGAAADKSTKVKMLVSSILEDCEMILLKNPDDADAIFSRAAVLTRGAMIGELASLNVEWVDLAVQGYERYLELVDPDDKMVPAAHYHAGVLLALGTMTGKQQSNRAKGRLQKLASQHYKQGMQAEEKRLPFFGPVSNIDSKQMLSLIMMAPKLPE